MSARTRIANIETLANAIAWRSDAATSDQMAFDLVVDEGELEAIEKTLEALHERLEAEARDPGGA